MAKPDNHVREAGYLTSYTWWQSTYNFSGISSNGACLFIKKIQGKEKNKNERNKREKEKMCDMGENKFLTSMSIKREALIITRKVNHDDTEKLL